METSSHCCASYSPVAASTFVDNPWEDRVSGKPIESSDEISPSLGVCHRHGSWRQSGRLEWRNGPEKQTDSSPNRSPVKQSPVPIEPVLYSRGEFFRRLEPALADQDRQQDERKQIRHRSLDEIGDQIASPELHVGGGSAAAAAASLAAATAELVVALTARRTSAAELGSTVHSDLDRLRSLRTELMAAGDQDEAALDRLMDSYKKKRGTRSELLVAAARTTLAIARMSAEVIQIAARQVPLASRFTASDLGAAAAIARGSATAGLLTARINIQLLEKDSGADHQTVDDLRATAADIDRVGREEYELALNATNRRIAPGGQGRA